MSKNKIFLPCHSSVNGATQETFYTLIRNFRCQKHVIKEYMEMTKKNYLETLKSVLGHSILHYFYCPPSQGCFTETITEHFSKINTNDTEMYLLGDFNINLFSKQKYIFHQVNTQSMSTEVKNYFQFCPLYGLEQLIKSAT